MPRVQAVLADPRFKRELASIDAAERDRRFCRHGLSHLLDVARIAWILALEDGSATRRTCAISREEVYAAALLHDIGRGRQYETGEDHDAAGERIASEILTALPTDLRFTDEQQAAILSAVAGHRGGADTPSAGTRSEAASARSAAASDLAALIRRADNLSRPCFLCPASEGCYWDEERRNAALLV